MTNTERVLNVTDHARMLKGAAFLDAHVPGWAALVATAILDIQSSQNCVISQLFGEVDRFDGIVYFDNAVLSMWANVGFEYDDDIDLYAWATEHGFDGFDDYEAASAAWRRVVQARV